ncbi:MAG: transcription termination/antitermination NusG family protein [Kiritimatiellae bacterium]|nr:transcription termination/antitermination NusG family protein [Kiritimatiellia bacterium]
MEKIKREFERVLMERQVEKQEDAAAEAARETMETPDAPGGTPSVPPDSEDFGPHPEGMHWVVLHTRPRAEKKLAQFCREQGFVHYLPCRKKLHVYGARRREFMNPLFPGYLFCLAPDQRAPFIKQNRYVANLLPVVAQGELIGFMNQLRRALNVGEELDVLPFIQKGKRVRVISGPYKGIESEVIELRGQSVVVLQIEILQKSVALPVDISCLGPLKD